MVYIPFNIGRRATEKRALITRLNLKLGYNPEVFFSNSASTLYFS